MTSIKVIFLVDDDVDDLEIFREALESIELDVECFTAVNGPWYRDRTGYL